MDTIKKSRGKPKSSISENDATSTENEVDVTAPNLNGDKNEEIENKKEESVVGGDEKSKEVDKPDKKVNNDELINDREKTKGKKRKASEMKSEDENANEENVKEKEDPKVPLETELNKKDETSDDLNLPPKQSLGKGKRARIPNKRYSDIILSPSVRRKSTENGSEKIEAENDLSLEVPIKEDGFGFTVASLKSRISTGSPSHALKKQKISTDLSDPKYLKPFKFGWKRELVWRATNDNNSRRNGDIYYYTPSGKKVRSMREVAENLKNKELTLDNFTFFKESLGIDDPDKEIIRDAKNKAGPVTLAKKAVTKAIKSPKSPKLSVSSPKISSPKISSPKVGGNETADSPIIKTKAAAKSLGNFKIKLPNKKDKKLTKSEEEMETDVAPVKTTPNRKTGKWSKATESPIKAKKRTSKLGSITNAEEKDESKFMDNYLQNLSYGYNTLLYVFQYLKVQDLLRAGCVCTMWRDIASHPMLWRTVRMKNSQVHSFEGLANTLKKHGTYHLDLRKMLLPTGGDEIWPQFSKAIEKVDTLRRIELCRCPASVVEKLAVSNPQLEVINAVTIKCESMDLEPLKALTNIKELRLKSTGGLTLTSNIDSLKDMKFIKHLSLTSIRDLNSMNLNVIAGLTNLESLDLGECTDFPRNFGSDIISKLEKLEKLRLEKGQGHCHTFEILDAVKDMNHLEQLELVNFDIKAGFDKALGACQNIKKLLIIPTYISQSATTNHMVLGGVLRLQKTLSHFVWGVTLELLRVTELFVDQCEEPDKKDKKEKKPVGNGDSIPVLKPVPLLNDRENEIAPAHDPPQVEILPLPNLQKLLLQSLPDRKSVV